MLTHLLYSIVVRHIIYGSRVLARIGNLPALAFDHVPDLAFNLHSRLTGGVKKRAISSITN